MWDKKSLKCIWVTPTPGRQPPGIRNECPNRNTRYCETWSLRTNIHPLLRRSRAAISMRRLSRPIEEYSPMMDQLPRDSGERRHSPLFIPAVPLIMRRKRWWKRHSRSTMLGALLLIIAIGASFIYAFRIEAERERAAAHRSP